MAGTIHTLSETWSLQVFHQEFSVSCLVWTGHTGLNLCGTFTQMKLIFLKDSIHCSSNFQFSCTLSHLTLGLKLMILESVSPHLWMQERYREKTQTGRPFLQALPLEYLMGGELSINADMEERTQFLIFLKSHRIREARMVLETWRTASHPQGMMATATRLVSKLMVSLQSWPAFSLEATYVV